MYKLIVSTNRSYDDNNTLTLIRNQFEEKCKKKSHDKSHIDKLTVFMMVRIQKNISAIFLLRFSLMS